MFILFDIIYWFKIWFKCFEKTKWRPVRELTIEGNAFKEGENYVIYLLSFFSVLSRKGNPAFPLISEISENICRKERKKNATNCCRFSEADRLISRL